MPIIGIRFCGAKCRTKNGEPCLQPAMRESNRCRMHFGHARKLRAHGRLTANAEEEKNSQRTLLKEMRILNHELKSTN